MDAIEVRSSSLDFTEIAQLADQGMVFVTCKMGMSSSRLLDWQDRAMDSSEVPGHYADQLKQIWTEITKLAEAEEVFDGNE
jgi:hypothetical protein